ncbi:2OG-Fe(II) oxygenase [Taibaiella soli]|uniref:Oxidoreductase, 2OG-Fe(II) oxygenase n=1 Tax=Taibaiella soli TaxID=1649169 RepID=A0A2W2BEE9_9BACT|nr:2OG-Fe(II) oxygenase [Taibaiella soli]PZF74277.1 oxidoreductase, 2OG-Fe(II) oxygenase [Taibaiella soli]
MKTTYHTDKIWTISGFLTPEECSELIAQSEQIGFEEAEVSIASGPQMMKAIRNNYRLMVDDEALAQRFWEELKQFCPQEIDGAVAVGLNEKFRFYKYESAQRFKRHIDGRFRRSENEESRITFMIYLNDDFEGGVTAFDDVTIIPETGTALCFIHELKHEGTPVISGVKYALRSDVMYLKSQK